MSVCVSVFKRDILVLFQTLSTVSHATSPSPQFFSNLELAQITLVLLILMFGNVYTFQYKKGWTIYKLYLKGS